MASKHGVIAINRDSLVAYFYGQLREQIYRNCVTPWVKVTSNLLESWTID